MSVLTQDLFRRLTETPGGPGDEGAVRDLIAGAIHPHVDELSIDRMGNLIALKRGTGDSDLRVAVAAHMDEVVLFVTQIDKDGLLHVARSGGVNARTLLGKTVQVGPDRLPGVISIRPPHMRKSADEAETVPDIDDLVIDIGAADDKAAKAKVKIGQRIAFQTPFRLLSVEAEFDPEAPLPAQGRISGKAFDDRIGCAALIELLGGEAYPFDLYGVFTVQEEIGLRGALAAGYHLQPDVVIILEGTVCADLPGPPGEPQYPTTRLGAGPALTQRDRSLVVHPPMLQHLLRTAEANGIPYQFKHPNIGGTDGAGFAFLRGIPVGIVSTPCRYIHSPVAIADLSDFHNVVALVRASLPGLDNVTGVRKSRKD
ncbi:MAG TPA: M42 family metallopeptidase [Caldilineae bacterium]|nr:M42 family metallopeptidase [Caldilineae bacterium]